MAARVAEQFQFGGVDARSNPANYPTSRAVRCKNWAPQQNGVLRLRLGYTQPTMGTVDAANAIHSAAYFELWAGTQYVMFGQSTALKRLAVSGGAVTTVGTLASGSPWNHYRANNKLFLGNGTDLKSYDGTTLRNAGIRAPNSTETAGVSVSASTATPGSFSTTTLTGYQLYLAYYNATTGHVGNRAKIGARVTIPGASYSLVVTGLPNLSGVDGEWVKAIGRTPDGGEVPYWITDAAGALVTVGNTATTATITSATVDFNSELPTRNDVPAGFDKFAKVLGRIFAAKPNEPYLYYSEAEEDAVNGIFVGRPEESWPANNAEAYPTGEVVTAVHGHKFEGWFFSKNHLAIWSEYLRQQLADPWRGPWPGGCAGQRAFVATPYGPFWVSGDKELMTFGDAGPVVVSDEYQRSLLAKVSDANLANTEIAYLRDPANDIDQLKIKGKDASNNPVVVVHDFRLRDGRSPLGQGYEASYTGITPNILAGAGYTPWTPVRDTNGKQRLWCGDTAGRFNQLEDGNSDNGATYTGDYISGPINLGNDEPLVIETEWVGDEKVAVSYSVELDDGLSQFVSAPTEQVNSRERRCAAKIGRSGSHVYVRFQLTAHPADGNFNLGDPPHVPVTNYGTMYSAKMKLGAQRPEGR